MSKDPGLRLIAHCDGAARGNPGPAGIGVHIADERGRTVAEIGDGIGVATNNVAEYRAAIEALRRAASLGASDLLIRSDSKLLVEQLAGRWRVKSPSLSILHSQARDLMRAFDRVILEHVPRELNRRADSLANRGVDQWLASQTDRSSRP